MDPMGYTSGPTIATKNHLGFGPPKKAAFGRQISVLLENLAEKELDTEKIIEILSTNKLKHQLPIPPQKTGSFYKESSTSNHQFSEDMSIFRGVQYFLQPTFRNAGGQFDFGPSGL